MATPLPPGLVWRKSSLSSDNGMCVEIATLPDRQVAVRDSKHPADHLIITHRALDNLRANMASHPKPVACTTTHRRG